MCCYESLNVLRELMTEGEQVGQPTVHTRKRHFCIQYLIYEDIMKYHLVSYMPRFISLISPHNPVLYVNTERVKK
jgi:hypothetical protein